MTKARTLADNFAADINGITAGTGITGGGTSGTVTITNDMATAINAKGDLVVGTGADAYSRLAVASTAGYLLTVDSAEATGLKWAASPNFVGCYAYRNNSNQSIPAITDTAITLPSELFDTNSFHSTATNTSRMTIPSGLGGKYRIHAFVQMSTADSGYQTFRIHKNGSAIGDGYSSGQIARTLNGSSDISQGHLILDLAANDYIEMIMYNQNALNAQFAVLTIQYLGA